MVGMPARCTHCGHQFLDNDNIVFEGDATDVVVNAAQTVCPKCGALAQYVQGRMNVQDGGFEMLSGPQWSWDLVDELRLTLKRAPKEDPANPLRPVATVDPQVADAIDHAVREGLHRSAVKNTSKNRKKLTRGVLMALFAVLSYDYGNTEQNVLTVRSTAEAVLRYVAHHGAIPPPWG